VARRRNAAAISAVFVFHRKPEGREDENDDGKGIRDKQKSKKSRRAGRHIKQKNNKRENKKGKKESRNKTECTLLARREEAIQLETGSEDWIYRRRRK
jgi:hypothetical protein